MIRRALILGIPLAITAALSSAAKGAPVEATQPSGHAATATAAMNRQGDSQ